MALGGRFSLGFETSQFTGCMRGGIGSTERGTLWLSLDPEGAVLQLDAMNHSGPNGTAGPRWYILLWTTSGERRQGTWRGEVSRKGDDAISIHFDADGAAERCYSLRAPDPKPHVTCTWPEEPKDFDLVCRFAAVDIAFETPRGKAPDLVKSYDSSSLQCTLSGSPPSRLEALSMDGKLTFPIDENVRLRQDSYNGRASVSIVLPDPVQ